MKKIKYLIPAVALMFGLASCDNMDELYKDYRTNYSIYSTKVKNLSGQSGLGRAVLAWTAPQDVVAKGIHISWNEGEEFIKFDELIEEYSVGNLAAGTYTFEVCTTDAHGNLSLPLSIDVKVYGEDDFKNMTRPKFSTSIAADNTHTLHISDISGTMNMWGGLFEIEAVGPNGEKVPLKLSQEFNPFEKKNSGYYSRAITMDINLGQALAGGQWNLTYKMNTYATTFKTKLSGVIYYTKICYDPYEFTGEAVVNVEEIVIPEPEPEAPAEGEETPAE